MRGYLCYKTKGCGCSDAFFRRMKAALLRQFEPNEQKGACTGTSGDPIKS